MVTLATHEWPPSGTDGSTADARLAVLVHGVSGWWRTWWRLGPALAERGWRVVAVDQRGHGASPRIADRVTVSGMAEDLAEAIEAHGARADALIGHSLGAAVSAELAVWRHELVRRLVLEDPPAVSRTDDAAWQARLLAEARAARERPDAEVARELAENPRWHPTDAEQNVEGRGYFDAEAMAESFRRGIGVRVAELVPLLGVPTLFVLGDEARSVYRGPAREALLGAPPANVRVEVLDAGHTVHRDRFDEYVALVAEWIEPR